VSVDRIAYSGDFKTSIDAPEGDAPCYRFSAV